MTTTVTFYSASGSEPIVGELAEPPPSGPKAPALLLIHEWWGINDHIRSLADRFAKEGFLVLAPDLFRGKTATNAEEAGALMGALDTLRAVKDIAGAARFLEVDARGNGKIGVTGFCMGGALAFASACHVPGLSAIVPFYGIPPAEKVDYANVTAPILAHFAKNDDWATVAKAEAIKKQLDGLGKPMTLEVYDAAHAFMNDTRPEVYDAESARLAWQRTSDFLKKHLT